VEANYKVFGSELDPVKLGNILMAHNLLRSDLFLEHVIDLKAYILLYEFLVIKQPLCKDSVELPAAYPLQNFLCGTKLWVLRVLNIGENIVRNVNVGCGVPDLILKVVDLIGREECIDNHVIDGFASTVRVAILEKSVASPEHLLNVLIDFGVVAYAIVEDQGARNQSVMLETD
jgi:hypothetical protein